MSREYLQMKYHPAKKEVKFRRFREEKEIAIGDGRLKTYMDKKGQFVLQDQGKKFFNDIARAFSGIKPVDIKVTTTELDYEDLVQMVEYYNRDPEAECQFNLKQAGVLPDMETTFAEVENFGERAIGVLEKHRREMLNIDGITNENVKEKAKEFAGRITKEQKNIRDKINSMKDSNVNLCFTGVYSAGKSALINAILGYRILPEAIKSETAKMFTIKSPEEGKKIEISFDINGEMAVLTWDENEGVFYFTDGPGESNERACIQTIIDSLKEESAPEYDKMENLRMAASQMAVLLKEFNSPEEPKLKNVFWNDIEISFPIPLDNGRVQFTIYDTPGTDSNYKEHKEVLEKALSNQTHSILIFVAAVNKLEGEGNNALMEYFKDAENNDRKTSVDLGRSLFVINWADTVDFEARETLQNGEIKYKGKKEEKDKEDRKEFSIKLSDKKLFFTSAKYAYTARARKNGIASKKEESAFKIGLTVMRDEYGGCCFRQNKCATSELATKRMLESCEQALEKTKEAGDEIKELEICSGIYALEKEIVQYGEKYASSVKAYAIIASVNGALEKLSGKATSCMNENDKAIAEIQREIKDLQKAIMEAINKEYEERSIKENRLPEETVKELGLDENTLDEEITGKAVEYIDEILQGWFFGYGRVIPKKGDSEKVQGECNRIINDYIDKFLKNRKKVLEYERDDFIDKITAAIKENGEISDEAKEFILDIPRPKVDSVRQVKDLGDIYKASKRTEGQWIFKREYVDKEKFKNEVSGKLLYITGEMHDDYCVDYRNTLETLLQQVISNYETNLDKYSLKLQGLIREKEALKNLGVRVEEAAVELKKCTNELNEIIWKEAK